MGRPPVFSIAIPARNGKRQLAATLDSIAASDFDLAEVEVLVIDDGSSDGTFEMLASRRDAFAVQRRFVEHGSQSATTNEALRLAQGEFVLFSAQDILFDRNLLNAHLAWHRRFAPEPVVVLGDLPYASSVEMTPFQYYLTHGGQQFAYFLIRDPLRVPPNFLYAPNFSLPRDTARKVGEFDERFPFGCQDTDYGIRLARQGVRIVYNRDAVGYHDHPTDLDAFCHRQRTVGRAKFHLNRKHPTFEGGLVEQDQAIARFLMCSDLRLDAARARIASLESALASRGDAWMELWDRAFCRQQSLIGLDADSRRHLARAEALFKCYEIVLSFHWAEGLLSEAVAEDGAESVARWIRARMITGQASIQVRNTMARRLRQLGIDDAWLPRRDYLTSRIVIDLSDYAASRDYLEAFQNPPASRCNCQVILVLDEGKFTPDERERLGEVVEIVESTDPDLGVLEALSRAEAELVAVTSADVTVVNTDDERLVSKLFSRIPRLAVAGGRILDDSRAAAAPAATAAPLSSVAPVDAAIPEYCWIRRSALEPLDDKLRSANSASGWNRLVCRRIQDGGGVVIRVPELAARRARSV